MRLILVVVLRLFALILIAGFGAWSVGVVWYLLPANETIRAGASTALGLLALCAAAGVFVRRLRTTACVFVALSPVVIARWSTIEPSDDRNFEAEVARVLSARVDGDRLFVSNVRDFEWRSETDFAARWVERTYDLARRNLGRGQALCGAQNDDVLKRKAILASLAPGRRHESGIDQALNHRARNAEHGLDIA